ncbi:MAG: guanylate kinase [Rhodospirillales bacterium CG15_BIG_FIL_POST_REV_8_21_14_020_66_15]|nr:MAG: guanylate kinase [Rhodospirillales bacterium CG15_BIG_FIL_POST_REV_8_21_14_020_66_15]
MVEISRRGMMLVLSSPSGAGKTSISRRLLAEETGIVMSVSATTRPPRPGEADGRDYYFYDPATFRKMAANGEFLEYATVFDNSYGTPKKPVMDALERGLDVLFDVDWQGTRKLRENAREHLVSVFILPPSIEELERRLRGRGQDTDEVVAGRMARAMSEMSHYEEYDYIVVNADLDASVDNVKAILKAERLKKERQTGLLDFVQGMGILD